MIDISVLTRSLILWVPRANLACVASVFLTFAQPKSGKDIRTYGKSFAHTLRKRLLRRLGQTIKEVIKKAPSYLFKDFTDVSLFIFCFCQNLAPLNICF